MTSGCTAIKWYKMLIQPAQEPVLKDPVLNKRLRTIFNILSFLSMGKHSCFAPKTNPSLQFITIHNKL